MPGLINVGSCGLHVVHGAFQSGAQKTKWDVNSSSKALYKLFDEFPANSAIMQLMEVISFHYHSVESDGWKT